MTSFIFAHFDVNQLYISVDSTIISEIAKKISCVFVT